VTGPLVLMCRDSPSIPFYHGRQASLPPEAEDVQVGMIPLSRVSGIRLGLRCHYTIVFLCCKRIYCATIFSPLYLIAYKSLRITLLSFDDYPCVYRSWTHSRSFCDSR